MKAQIGVGKAAKSSLWADCPVYTLCCCRVLAAGVNKRCCDIILVARLVVLIEAGLGPLIQASTLCVSQHGNKRTGPRSVIEFNNKGIQPRQGY